MFSVSYLLVQRRVVFNVRQISWCSDELCLVYVSSVGSVTSCVLMCVRYLGAVTSCV